MDADKRAELLAKAEASDARLAEELAPLYATKECPYNGFQKCRGPRCGIFLPMGDGGLITGGACSIPLIASQVGPIGGGLAALAEGASRNSHVIAGR